MKPLIIAYDITKPAVRRRVLNQLKGWRLSGQKSVHECRLDDAAAKRLFKQLSEMADPETDCLFMARLENHRKVLCRGVGECGFDSRLFYIR